MTNGSQRLLNKYLTEYQDRYRQQGFTWGELDCVHFVADWVLRLTGNDPLGDYRGAYSTALEAMTLLREKDGTLLEALTKRLGEPVHPSKAHRGDIAYIESLNACGIYFTSGARMRALFLGEGGFVLQRARDTDHAFRVG